MVPAEGAVQVQVLVQAGDEAGRRAVEIHARTGNASVGAPRQRGAGPGAPAATRSAGEFAAWPPAGAVQADVDGLYAGLAAAGYGYGPAFRGLRAAWRRGDDVFAEVALPEEAAGDAGSFGVHPALLDAALHAAGALGPAAGSTQGGGGGAAVRVARGGACTRRARRRCGSGCRRRAGGGCRWPRRMPRGRRWCRWPRWCRGRSRPGSWRRRGRAAGRAVRGGVDPGAGAGPGRGTAGGAAWAVAGADCSVWRRSWRRLVRRCHVPGPGRAGGGGRAGAPVPGLVLACAGRAGDAGPRYGRGEARRRGRRWRGCWSWCRDGWVRNGWRVRAWWCVTRGAVAAAPGEGVSDLAGAAVWGLVRSAQSENPGRIVLAGPMPACTAS